MQEVTKRYVANWWLNRVPLVGEISYVIGCSRIAWWWVIVNLEDVRRVKIKQWHMKVKSKLLSKLYKFKCRKRGLSFETLRFIHLSQTFFPVNNMQLLCIVEYHTEFYRTSALCTQQCIPQLLEYKQLHYNILYHVIAQQKLL